MVAVKSRANKWNWSRVENIYFVVALILGSLFAILTPPFQVADETAHFYRSALIAEGNWFTIQGEIPESIQRFAEEIRNLNLEHESENKVDPGILLKGWVMPLQKEKKAGVTAVIPANYSPILYLPQAIGVRVGIALNISPYKLLLLSRWMSLIFGVFVTTLAIRICPFRKWSLLFITLLPMTLSLYGSASADALTISLSILYVSLVLYLRQNGHTRTHLIWFGLATLTLAFVKPGYVFLCLLIIVIPIFPQKKLWDRTAKFVVVFFTFLLFAVWFTASQNFGPKQYMALPGVDAAGQLDFILSNPLVFLLTYFRDLFTDLAGSVVTFIGVFGWVDTVLPYWVYVIYEFSLGLTLVFDNNYPARSLGKMRFVFLAIFLVNFLIVYSIFYFTFTPVGADFINGFVGRYALPIISLVYFAFYNKRKKFQFNKIYLFLPIWVIGGIISLLTILVRYYG